MFASISLANAKHTVRVSDGRLLKMAQIKGRKEIMDIFATARVSQPGQKFALLRHGLYEKPPIQSILQEAPLKFPDE